MADDGPPRTTDRCMWHPTRGRCWSVVDVWFVVGHGRCARPFACGGRPHFSPRAAASTAWCFYAPTNESESQRGECGRRLGGHLRILFLSASAHSGCAGCQFFLAPHRHLRNNTDDLDHHHRRGHPIVAELRAECLKKFRPSITFFSSHPSIHWGVANRPKS